MSQVEKIISRVRSFKMDLDGRKKFAQYHVNSIVQTLRGLRLLQDQKFRDEGKHLVPAEYTDLEQERLTRHVEGLCYQALSFWWGSRFKKSELIEIVPTLGHGDMIPRIMEACERSRLDSWRLNEGIIKSYDEYTELQKPEAIAQMVAGFMAMVEDEDSKLSEFTRDIIKKADYIVGHGVYDAIQRYYDKLFGAGTYNVMIYEYEWHTPAAFNRENGGKKFGAYIDRLGVYGLKYVYSVCACVEPCENK